MTDPKLKPGTNYCKCSCCGLYFGGVSAFDLHRYQKDGGGCLDPAQVRGKKDGRPLLKLTERGYWSLAKPVKFSKAA